MAIKSCWFAPHAAAAYLLGAERLFANAPTVEIGAAAVVAMLVLAYLLNLANAASLRKSVLARP